MLLMLVAEIVVDGDDTGLMDGSAVVTYEGTESEAKQQKSGFQSRSCGYMNSGGRRDRRKKMCRERLCSKNMEDWKKWIYEAHLFMGDERENCRDYNDSDGKYIFDCGRSSGVQGIGGGRS